MFCYNNFRNSTHSHRVATDRFDHSIFCGSFKSRSLQSDVAALMCFNSEIFRYFCRNFDHFFIVRFTHIHKARSEFFHIFSPQRMFRHHVDMVVDDHDICNVKSWIYAATRI